MKYINKKHSFSIVLTITELATNNNSNRLYGEMINLNEIKVIVQAVGEADVNLDV